MYMQNIIHWHPSSVTYVPRAYVCRPVATSFLPHLGEMNCFVDRTAYTVHGIEALRHVFLASPFALHVLSWCLKP